MNDTQLGRFFFKLISSLIVIFLLDLAVGNILKHFYYKQESGSDYQATYAIDSVKADFLIMGSSRAANLFDTRIIQDQFGLSCYNTGRYGYPVFYHFALLEAILQRHKPKIVILSFDAGNLGINQDAYDRLSSLLPYYNNHPEIRPIVNLKGRYEKIKMLSSAYPYNSLLLPIISGNTAYSKGKYPTFNGYIPLDEQLKYPLREFDYTKDIKLDTVKINIYKAFIERCKKLDIQLFIICTPYIIKAKGIDLSVIEGKRIAKIYEIPFFDYSNDTTYTKRPQLFADFRHLNKNGVPIFTNEVSQRIKEISK